MSKNHGYIKYERPAKPAPLAIPRVLQRAITHYSDRDKNAGIYGLWQMVALEDITVAGVRVKKGDLFKVPGNEAVMLARDRTAEFTDSRVAEEAEALEKVKKLGLDKPAQPAAENFQPVQRERRSWAKGVAA